MLLTVAAFHLEAQEQKVVRVAAAADLEFAIFAQIQEGAPFDLFFSADMDYPKKLEASGFAEACRSQQSKNVK